MPLPRSSALLLALAAILTAANPSPSEAQARAGLPAGSCVVTLYGSPVVVTGPAPGGYNVRSVTGGGWVVHYAGIKEAPCPSNAPAANARPATLGATGRAQALTPAAPALRNNSPAGGPTPGKYHCVLFISGSLVTQSGFTLLPGGRYTHQLGGGGTTRVSAGVIEFSGGPLAGQAGKVSPGRVNLFNPTRSRTVIDCETQR